jgi:hypothetical protein
MKDNVGAGLLHLARRNLIRGADNDDDRAKQAGCALVNP